MDGQALLVPVQQLLGQAHLSMATTWVITCTTTSFVSAMCSILVVPSSDLVQVQRNRVNGQHRT